MAPPALNENEIFSPVSLVAPAPGVPSHEPDLEDPHLYINRELSWLEFNQRVLDQANDPSHPLLERVKFFAIAGMNMDEFSMVRVATLLKKFRAHLDDVTPDGMTTKQQLDAIRKRTSRMIKDQNDCWEKTLAPLLAEEGIYFLEPDHYSPAIIKYLRGYFYKQIFPILTPLAVDPGHPFPHISNLSMNFAVVVKHDGETKFARLKIPAMLPRFIPLPEKLCEKIGMTFVFIEDVIRINIKALFPDTEIQETALFRVIRDTDIVIHEDEADDLLETVGQSLQKLKYGAVSFLQVEEGMSLRVQQLLTENFELGFDVLVMTRQRMAFANWMELSKINKPKLKDQPFLAATIFDQAEPSALFEKLKHRDYVVHHPYESFDSVEDFLDRAVDDPHVLAIKMTLYRIGEDPPVMQKLIQAAEANKQVTVLLELKARFDEKNNIAWAKKLESVGVHVVYGLINLKTHCKLCCVIRKEPDGSIKRYLHIGTGNYNPATARVYTDLGLFTANDEIADDVSEVFNYLTGFSHKKEYKHLIVAPMALRLRLAQLIEREMDHAHCGRAAHIIIKNNAVADLGMVQSLYKASRAGVAIDLIVRGVCTLRPNIKGVSENIRVISIIGRFLEHCRIYYFENGGEPEIFIGSADLMERNLDRRVEILCPVFDPKIKEYLKQVVLDAALKDNGRASRLHADGTYHRIQPKNPKEAFNSQEYLLGWHLSRHNAA